MALSVKRFSKWSKSHQKRYLKQRGQTTQQFRKAKPGAQRRTLGKAAPKKKSKPVKVVDPYAEQVASATKLKYGPAESELASQRRISIAQEERIPGFFADYQRRLNDLAQGQAAGYNQAKQELSSLTAASQSQSTQAAQAALEQLRRQAKTQGAEVDPSLGAQAEQATAARRFGADAFGGVLAAQNLAQTGYQRNLQAASAAEKLNQLTAERRRRRQIEGKGEELAKEKGTFAQDFRRQLAEDAFKRKLEAAAFGLKESEAAASLADKRFQRRSERRKTALDEKKFASEEEKDAYQRANKLGPYKPAAQGKGGTTPASRRAHRGALRAAKADARLYHSRKKLYDRKNPSKIHPERRKKLIDVLVKSYAKEGLTRREARKIVWQTAFGKNYYSKLYGGKRNKKGARR
jgi:hypothetical protein